MRSTQHMPRRRNKPAETALNNIPDWRDSALSNRLNTVKIVGIKDLRTPPPQPSKIGEHKKC